MENKFKGGVILVPVLLIWMQACLKTEDYPVMPKVPLITSVETRAPEMVTTNSANLSGRVEAEAGGKIFETGFYLFAEGGGLSESVYGPAISVTGEGGTGMKIISPDAATGDFYAYLDGLSPNRIYRFVAYATGEGGTFFGERKVLVTSFGTVSDLEGNIYQTVLIGDQEWMRENLKSTIYADNVCVNGCYQMADDPKYGKRFSWKEANRPTINIRTGIDGGVCPTGWHVPSDVEWQQLLVSVGVSPGEFSKPLVSIDIVGVDQAVMLKDGGSEFWANSSVTNLSGFSILPADICAASGNSSCVKTAFWTSTQNVFYGFQMETDKIVRGKNPSDLCGMSVRCIKNR